MSEYLYVWDGCRMIRSCVHERMFSMCVVLMCLPGDYVLISLILIKLNDAIDDGYHIIHITPHMTVYSSVVDDL
jgi:hypothetical protein